jgi:U3 small nucleolar RNA-associated protein 6
VFNSRFSTCSEAKARFPTNHRLEFFKLMLQYYLLKLDAPNKVHDIFKMAITDSCKAVSVHFQPEYIEWLALTRSIEMARKVYQDLTTSAPVCLAIHQTMARLEGALITPNVENWRQCHEFATQYFGKDRIDVWIDYIKFEQNFGEPKKCQGIYERARSTLNVELVDNFVTAHSLITLG